MPPYFSCGVIKVCVCPDFQIWLKHHDFSLNVLYEEDNSKHLGWKHGADDLVLSPIWKSDDATGAEWRHFMFLSVVFLHLTNH